MSLQGGFIKGFIKESWPQELNARSICFVLNLLKLSLLYKGVEATERNIACDSNDSIGPANKKRGEAQLSVSKVILSRLGVSTSSTEP